MAYTSYSGSKSFKDWCKFRAIDISDGWELVANGKGPRLAYANNKATVTGEADADWVAQSEAKGVELWAKLAAMSQEMAQATDKESTTNA